jgi:Spy/CpxP family protein refolding chaperone
MKERTLIYLVVVLVVINVAALSAIIYQRFANPSWGAGRPRHGMDMEPGMLGGLQLTSEQREVMMASRQRLDSLTAPMRVEIQKRRRELLVEMDGDHPDTALIGHLVTDIGGLQVEIEKAMIHRLLDDGRVLRPEQRRAFLRLIEMRARGQERPMFEPGKGFGRGREGVGQ